MFIYTDSLIHMYIFISILILYIINRPVYIITLIPKMQLLTLETISESRVAGTAAEDMSAGSCGRGGSPSLVGVVWVYKLQWMVWFREFWAGNLFPWGSGLIVYIYINRK